MAGRRGELADFRIADIAVTRKAVLATRDTCRFEGSDIRLVDPWRDT